ncbi:guanine nucleotide-binding protein-like protein [Leptomonas seymouri]|uniref:Guanine nucleotide-binding protein-like protein n=1 Tax=Leptomonas seymouri TaxID=5684 RepID=A0A0N1IKL4_LEPSE|nr:guanine nucleotide-binding protein-like protein [Leptomonas seymouri]|eukprot:KPI86371.1 guanine nucleotide-binding protein-like protein [Leptomonas seymouri]
MSVEPTVNVGDDERGGNCGGDRRIAAPANAAALSPRALSTSNFATCEPYVYVAYPRPVMQINGMHSAAPMPSIIGQSNKYLRTYKILLVGEAGVGKSNLMQRYCYNKYDPELPCTIGIEFCSREVDIPSGPVGATESVVLQIWDTAGQERNTGVISNAFYRNAVGAIVVYDVTQRDTLLNVPRWVARVMELAREECVCVVVGAKLDLLKTPQDTPVSRAEVEALQQEADCISHALGVRNFLASALSGEGVLEAFTHLVLAVDAVQATPPAVRGDTARQQPDALSYPSTAQHDIGDNGQRVAASQESTMWTAASTVPTPPVSLFDDWPSRSKSVEAGHESQALAQGVSYSTTNGSTASGPSPTLHYQPPGTISNASQWQSPSPTPVKQKKSLDLRGFGLGEGGNPAVTTGSGAGASWGC